MRAFKVNKIIVISLLIIFILCLTNVSLAVSGFGDIQSQVKEFEEKGKSGGIDMSDVIDKLLPVGRILVGIGSIVLVVVGAIMGVKYMISGTDQKAQLKQKLIYYVISIVIIYGAVGIFTVVVNIMNLITAK